MLEISDLHANIIGGILSEATPEGGEGSKTGQMKKLDCIMQLQWSTQMIL